MLVSVGSRVQNSYLHDDVWDLHWCCALLAVGSGPVRLAGVVHVEHERYIVQLHVVVNCRLRVRLRRAWSEARSGAGADESAGSNCCYRTTIENNAESQAVGKSDTACRTARATTLLTAAGRVERVAGLAAGGGRLGKEVVWGRGSRCRGEELVELQTDSGSVRASDDRQ
eukprot:SAG22_NODE_968_length_6253_cov_7.174033_8_plen_170_part_00